MAGSREPLVGVNLAAWRDIPVTDLLVRFGFGAAISAVAGIVSVVMGSEPGGILLAFPAILPATLTLIEKEDGERQAEDLDVGSILGAAALGAFAVIVWQYMGSGFPPLVLVSATVAWLVAAVVLYLGLRLLMAEKGPLHRSIAELRAG